MLEKDLQDYLFSHPEVLFPGLHVTEKQREFCIEGKRIDLLFHIDGVRHIVELKAVPLTREHVGQIAEYYGLMRTRYTEGEFKLTLVAPSIPAYRSALLETIGIRCVEVPEIPTTQEVLREVREQIVKQQKLESKQAEISTWAPEGDNVAYGDLVGPVTRKSLALSHRFLADTVDGVSRCFAEYETLPTRMQRAESGHYICGFPPIFIRDEPIFTGGGAWWAYTFGMSEAMPKNDVPNLSVEAMPWGLDLAVNAEIHASQRIMRGRISNCSDGFDKLIAEHGNLQFQALLKFEHQPRMYHWLPLFLFEPKAWTGSTVLDTYSQVEKNFSKLRTDWIAWIGANQKRLSRGQVEHLNRQNRRPTLALRLIRSFSKADTFWTLRYAKQCESLMEECAKLKPLIDFFCK
jgi:Endonuclease NucS